MPFLGCDKLDAFKQAKAQHEKAEQSAHDLAAHLAEQVSAKVTGSIHSVGGRLGTWDVTLNDCRSGEAFGFFGVDFYAPGSDALRLRYVHDEANGTIVKIAYPTKPGTVYELRREDSCAVLEGSLRKTNVSTWTPQGNIRHLNGNVKFDCPVEGQGRVTGEATFSDCNK